MSKPSPFSPFEPASGTSRVTVLPNGVRVLVLPMPWRTLVSLSVFVRAGSLHESRRTQGICHLAEHMAFKGTGSRDNHRINLDAERLGAEFTAHTDRDHTAFHIEGLPQDLNDFVHQVADIVLDSRFPEAELSREREVIGHEFTELEDDAVTLAFQLFDRAAWGDHPAGWPVIGRRATVARLTRDDLLAHVQQHHTGCNLIVAAAGPVQADAFTEAVGHAFGALRAGTPNTIAAPRWQGGVKLRRLAGSTQCHVVLGFEAPPLTDPRHVDWQLAAAVLGEGMSSPLLERLREQRGLAYHLNASADIGPFAGDFVVDASVEPARAGELLTEVQALCRELARDLPHEHLERARNQWVVRLLRDAASPSRRLELAAQDLFTLGAVREPEALARAIQSVPAAAVQAVFARLLEAPAALGLSGQVPSALRAHAAALFRLGLPDGASPRAQAALPAA